MAQLVWSKLEDRTLEVGVDRGVVYPMVSGAYPKGEVWNGLMSVSSKPEGAEPNDFYADNIKYGSIMSNETYGGSIEAYAYPESFAQCDGSLEAAPGVFIGQQRRVPFGLSYRTMIKNGTFDEADDGYKIHLIYNAIASPSETTYNTINDSPDANTMSWDFKCTPHPVDGYKPVSKITIDTTKVKSKENLTALEKKIWGDSETDAMLPLPSEVIALFPEALTVM